MSSQDFSNQSVSQRQETVYARSAARNIPSQPLQANLSTRPVMTKYTTLSVINPSISNKTPITQRPTYNMSQVFNPGNDRGPWSGYSSNVNDESIMRNQIYATQSRPQATYIPDSSSSLYNVKWQNKNNALSQPFPDLFKNNTGSFASVDPNPDSQNVGFSLFNNATRQQIKDLD